MYSANSIGLICLTIASGSLICDFSVCCAWKPKIKLLKVGGLFEIYKTFLKLTDCISTKSQLTFSSLVEFSWLECYGYLYFFRVIRPFFNITIILLTILYWKQNIHFFVILNYDHKFHLFKAFLFVMCSL